MGKKSKKMSEEAGTYTVKVDDSILDVEINNTDIIEDELPKISSIDIHNNLVLVDGLKENENYLLKDLKNNTSIKFMSFGKTKVVKCISVSRSMIIEKWH